MGSRAWRAGTGRPRAPIFFRWRSIACWSRPWRARGCRGSMPRRRLAALLHDAPEYVIGDMISPFKAVIGDAYKAVERRLLAAIHLRFGLPSEIAAGSRAIDQSRRSASRLSRSDPARRLRARRSAALFRRAAEILRRHGTRLPEAMARRDGAGALRRTVPKASWRVNVPSGAFSSGHHLIGKPDSISGACPKPHLRRQPILYQNDSGQRLIP